MIYPFDNAPEPANIVALNEMFTQRMSGLSDDEIAWIRNYGDALPSHAVALFGQSTPADVMGVGATYPLNDDTRWLYDRMAQLCRDINADDYQYDLSGFTEPFYHRRYEAPHGHFEWHTDATSRTGTPRKLTVVLQMSHPDEYEGGDFEFLGTRGSVPTMKAKGVVTAFPSYQIHRVTPVTAGTRYAMTMFLAGPNFR